jgi:hypothetical protein
MERMKSVLLAIAVVGVLLVGQLTAAPVIGSSEDWTTPPTDWNYAPIDGASGVSMFDTAGDLQLRFTGGGQPRAGVLFADSGTQGGNFIGDYYNQSVDFHVTFSVHAYDAQASSLGLYFQNTSGVGNEWVYILTPPAVGSSSTYTLTMNDLWNFNNWQNLSLANGAIDFATWQADFSSVDRFGIYVVENQSFTGVERYGLDDLTLAVPEPETVWLIFAALVSLGVTFRSKVSETVRGLVKAT